MRNHNICPTSGNHAHKTIQKAEIFFYIVLQKAEIKQ